MSLKKLAEARKHQTPTGSYKSRMGDQWVVADRMGIERVSIDDAHINAWWAPEHGIAIRHCIADYQWCWISEVDKYLWPEIHEQVALDWALSDPRIDSQEIVQIAKHDRHFLSPLLRGFAEIFAKTHSLTEAIRPSETKSCAFCEEPFEERALAPLFIRALGHESLEVCGFCLYMGFLQHTSAFAEDDFSKAEVLTFVERLTSTIDTIPPFTFGIDQPGALRGLSVERLTELLDILWRRPSRKAVKRHFGSWFGALVATGVLDNDSQQTARGIKSIAIDGHVCFSTGERTIDDLLTNSGIPHTREPPYPESRMRGDFLIGRTIVEYLGLVGDREYDAKTERKKALAAQHDIPLLLVVPQDLGDLPKLKLKFKAAAALIR